MEAAYRLGELAVLSHVYAEEDRQRKKPRQPRLKPKISAACINLVNGNPEITNSEAWIAFDDERIAGGVFATAIGWSKWTGAAETQDNPQHIRSLYDARPKPAIDRLTHPMLRI